MGNGADIIIIGVSVGVLLAVVDAAGGNAVAEHFCHISFGHLHRLNFFAGNLTEIRPIFGVMLIASLVVKPCGAIAFFAPFCIIGTAEALIVFAAPQKFHRAIFGKIVAKPLSVKSQTETVSHDKVSVPRDRSEMTDGIHKDPPLDMVSEDLVDISSDMPTSLAILAQVE